MLPSNKTVILFFPGPLGGAEMIVAQGFKALLQIDPNIELWMVGETRSPEALNHFSTLVTDLPTKTFWCRSILDFKLIRRLRQELEKNQIQLVHAHGFKAAVYGKLSTINQKLIITHHGKTAHTLKVRVYEFIEEMVMKRSDRVIAVSQTMQENLFKAGITSTLIENFLTIKEAPRTELTDNPLKLIFIGRLSPEKGCCHLIQAMNEINEENILLTVVGDGVERSELEALSQNTNTTFLGFRKDISSLLGQHHVLVMPSLREGLPLTLIEATCNQLPIIATSVGGIPTLVKDNKNGILVPPENDSALKKAILKMKENLESFRGEAEKLAPTYQKRFSIQTWADKTYELYKLFIH